MGGEYDVVDGRLVLAGLGRDDIGCTPESTDQDTWLSDLLLAGPTIMRDGDLLVIHGSTATITMIDNDIAHPDVPLLGTTWVFNGFFDAQSASMPLALGAATIVFDWNTDTYSLETGCNHGSGTFTVHADMLTINADSWSDRFCSADTARAEMELRDVLAGDLRIFIDGGALTLTRSDGHGLSLRANA